MNRGLLITIAIAALLLGVGTAWSTPPDQDEGQILWDDYLADCDTDFSLCEMGDYSYRSKLFYLKNGDPWKYVEKIKFLGGMYECGNQDNFLAYDPLSYTYTENYVSGELIVHGLFAKISIPGYGQIFKDVGNIVIDLETGDILFEAGEHEWWNEEFELVCEILMNGV